MKTTKGRYGGTLGHWQIALAYAKYLAPGHGIRIDISDPNKPIFVARDVATHCKHTEKMTTPKQGGQRFQFGTFEDSQQTHVRGEGRDCGLGLQERT